MKVILARRVVGALGRLGCAMNAVPSLRPFLGPFYAWTASLPGVASVRLPAMLRLILVFLVDEIG
eukprot:7672690-Karenia_brevis.AAC.1